MREPQYLSLSSYKGEQRKEEKRQPVLRLRACEISESKHSRWHSATRLLGGAKPHTPYISKEECDEKEKQNDIYQMHRR